MTASPALPESHDGPVVTIDITSDPLCPYSYVSYKRLSRALDTYNESTGPLRAIFRVHPFIIDPAMKENCLYDRAESLKITLGEKSVPFWERVIQEAKTVDIDLAKTGLCGQTIDAQRLLLLALRTMGPAAQYRLWGIICHVHFDLGKDITSPDILAKIATSPIAVDGAEAAQASDHREHQGGTESHGQATKLNRALFDDSLMALAWLKSGALRKDVIVAARRSRDQGIKGVPFVVINGKFAICGAQKEEAYVEVRLLPPASEVCSRHCRLFGAPFNLTSHPELSAPTLLSYAAMIAFDPEFRSFPSQDLAAPAIRSDHSQRAIDNSRVGTSVSPLLVVLQLCRPELDAPKSG